MIDREMYAAPAAMEGAKGRGWNFSLADWRDVFLAITDTIAEDGRGSIARNVVAQFVGPLRDGAERWRIRAPWGAFDCVYYPERACVMQFIRPREPDDAVSTRPPRAPAPMGAMA